MAIPAYAQSYLDEAKRHLGACTDFLLNVAGLSPVELGRCYASSPTMRQFGRGAPDVIAGLSGLELAARLWRERFADRPLPEAPRGGEGYSPAYWTGWALADFQWYWCLSFRWIFARCTLDDILGRYPVYHEMDVTHFRTDFKVFLDAVKVDTNLRRLRLAAGLSQAQLAARSGINVRNIQLYEQRVQDVNRASAAALDQLARTLGCTIEDIME